MTDEGGSDPEARSTLDDASARARETHPDPLLQAENGGPARSTLPDLEAAGAPPEERLPDDDAPFREGGPEVDAAAHAATMAVRKRGWVYLLVGGLFFAALAGPLLFYFFVWRYRPTAVQHVPEGSNAAARIDGNELYLFDPFREHVLSVFAESRDLTTRADRLKRYTGIDVRSDLREVVVATTSGEGYVVLLGGKFERTRLSQDTLVDGLKIFFDKEGVQGFTVDGDVLVGHGVRIAQADDSTIVIATHEEGLRAALEPSDAWTRLGLASSGAASFVIQRPALAAAARSLPPGASDPFAHADRVGGFLKLGREPSLFVDVTPSAGIDPEALAREVESSLDAARLLVVLLPDIMGEKGALSSAKVKPRTASVMIEAAWPREGLGRGCEALGATLRQLFASGTPPAEP
jgi:hypothetical protein